MKNMIFLLVVWVGIGTAIAADSDQHPKIAPQILKQVNLHMRSGGARADNALGNGWSLPQAQEHDQRLRVYIESDALDEDVLSDLRAAGVEIEIVNDTLGVIQGKVPLDRVLELADHPDINYIRLPDYGHPHSQGSVGTEGDAVIGADNARALFSVNGNGIRVGVISDGRLGSVDSMASGDLPANIGSRSFRADGDLNAGAEGTALLEIVHDIAPGAELFFANFDTGLEFIQAVDWLADQAGGPNTRRGTTGGVDILVEDIGFFNAGPYDGSSAVSQALTRASNSGVMVVASVGNSALDHYQGLFTDPDGDNLHDFGASLGQPPVDNSGETLNITVQGRSTVTIALQWNDPFGASNNDYDLCAHDPADLPGSSILCSEAFQDGNDNPVELLSVTRSLDTPGTLGISILNFNGLAAPREFDLFVLNGRVDEFNVLSSSVPNVSDARNVLSVGAVNFSTPGAVESFSSQGPTNDGRLKPELAAPDGVSVTGSGGFGSPFFGTSAAAPHVAGVAALMLQLKPYLTPPQLQEMLTFTATDIAAAGIDFLSGHGLANAVDALDLINSGYASFSPATGTLHVPAVELPNGSVFAVFMNQVPGSFPLRASLTNLIALNAPTDMNHASFSFETGVLHIPGVELSDGRVFEVSVTQVPGSEPITGELTNLLPLN